MEKFVKKQRIIFNPPGENDIVGVIFEILKNSGIEETEKEAYEKSISGKDSNLFILRDAAITIFQKNTPEKKLIDFLVKQLETSKQVAENIVKDINEKLIPYAKIIDTIKEAETESKNKTENKSDYDKEKYRQDLLRKISPNSISIKEVEEILPPKVKKPETADVEKNAEKIQHTQKREEEEKSTQEKEKKVDIYKEPIE